MLHYGTGVVFSRQFGLFCAITIVHRHASTVMWVVFSHQFGPFCASFHCGVGFQPSVRSFPCHNHCPPACVHCDVGCFQPSFQSFLCHNQCPLRCGFSAISSVFFYAITSVHCGVGCFQPSVRFCICHNQCPRACVHCGVGCFHPFIAITSIH